MVVQGLLSFDSRLVTLNDLKGKLKEKSHETLLVTIKTLPPSYLQVTNKFNCYGEHEGRLEGASCHFLLWPPGKSVAVGDALFVPSVQQKWPKSSRWDLPVAAGLSAGIQVAYALHRVCVLY